MKDYTLYLHFKQGDDFSSCLDQTDTPSEALELWAEIFQANAEHCQKLAKALEGSTIEMDGDTHHIGLSPSSKSDMKLLADLAEQELIEVDEFEDEDVFQECDEDDDEDDDEDESEGFGVDPYDRNNYVSWDGDKTSLIEKKINILHSPSLEHAHHVMHSLDDSDICPSCTPIEVLVSAPVSEIKWEDEDHDFLCAFVPSELSKEAAISAYVNFLSKLRDSFEGFGD